MAKTSAHRAVFTVVGMTCEHCVMSVQEAFDAAPELVLEHLDLASGGLAVVSDLEFSRASVAAVVAEAGYELAD